MGAAFKQGMYYTSVANISLSPPKVWVLLDVPEDMPGK